MEINLGLILASLINFFILFAILKHFFFNKVEAIIEEREEYINKQMDDAEEATNKARLLAIENERILKQAREEGKKITEEKKKKAEKIYDEIVLEAKNEADATIFQTEKSLKDLEGKVSESDKKSAEDKIAELKKTIKDVKYNEMDVLLRVGVFAAGVLTPLITLKVINNMTKK